MNKIKKPMLEQTTEFNYTKASRRRRIFAFIIDAFVINNLLYSIVSIVYILFSQNYVDDIHPSDIGSISMSSMVLGFLLFCAKESIKGISIGKWMMGIMVRDKKQPNMVPSFARLMARNVFTIILPVEFIVLLLRKDKEKLGDQLVQAIVVNNPNQSPIMSRIVVFVLLLILLPLFSFFVGGHVLKKSGAYAVAVAQIEQNDEIKAEVGGIKGYGWFPSGKIKMLYGHGQAILLIKVVGLSKDIDIVVYLRTGSNGQWELIDIRQQE